MRGEVLDHECLGRLGADARRVAGPIQSSGATVVAPLPAAGADVRLAPHAAPALAAIGHALEGPGAMPRDRGAAPALAACHALGELPLLGGDNRLMQAGPQVGAAAIDRAAGVERGAPEYVAHRLLAPRLGTSSDAAAVEIGRHGGV